MRISDWSSDVCSSDLIDKGAAWARRRRGRDMLSEDFVRTLHKRMFGEVWAWAGSYRRTARNIGVDAYRIPAEVAQLLDDVRYWVEHHTYDPDSSEEHTSELQSLMRISYAVFCLTK